MSRPGEVEAVEVVAWLDGDKACVPPPSLVCYEQERKTFDRAMKANGAEPLMTIAQHQRIVAAKDAELEALHALCEDRFNEIAELRAQLAAQKAAVPRLKVKTVPKPYRCIDGSEGWTIKGDVVIYPTEAKAKEQAEKVDSARALAMFNALEFAAPAAPQQGDGTTSDKYRAELYDEVWQKARGMGFGNVTMALDALSKQQGVVMPDLSEITDEMNAAGLKADKEFHRCAADRIDCIFDAMLKAARLNADRSAQTHAARDVLAERRRQVEAEGWTPEHDDEHGDGQMAVAGGLYAQYAFAPLNLMQQYAPPQWPWHESWWRPGTPRRNLVKAGALILAEIERLDRSAQGGGRGDS